MSEDSILGWGMRPTEASGPVAEFASRAALVGCHRELARLALELSPRFEGASDRDGARDSLDALIEGACASIPASRPRRERRAALADYLFVRQGYGAAPAGAFTPVHTLLDGVLLRQRGIPISLAMLYLACAEACELDAWGINFPGHFLVGCRTNEGSIVVDPFHGGRELDREELAGQLALAGNMRDAPEDALELQLVPCSPVTILKRLLANLRAMYFRAGDFPHTLIALEYLIALAPEEPSLRRERGMVLVRVGAFSAAREDFESYLQADPHGEDAEIVREHLAELPAETGRLH